MEAKSMAENELFGGIALDGDLSPYDYSNPISVLASDEIWGDGCLTDPIDTISDAGLSVDFLGGTAATEESFSIEEQIHSHVSRNGTIAMIHRIEEVRPGVHELRMMICELASNGKQRFFRAMAYEEDALDLSDRARTGDSIQIDGVVSTTPWGQDWVERESHGVKMSRAAVLIAKYKLTREA
jgi:hypothetical protein